MAPWRREESRNSKEREAESTLPPLFFSPARREGPWRRDDGTGRVPAPFLLGGEIIRKRLFGKVCSSRGDNFDRSKEAFFFSSFFPFFISFIRMISQLPDR